MPPPQNKTEFQAFLGIINNLGTFSPSTATVCEPLQELTSSRAVCSLNASYQALYNKAKLLIKSNVCMRFYNKTKPLYLETDASRIGLDTTLLQTRDNMTCPKDTSPDNTILRPITFVRKKLTSAEWSIVTSKEKHWVYCMVSKKFTIIALLGR